MSVLPRLGDAYSHFRIAVALEGHADVNSTDGCTVAGTSPREIELEAMLPKIFLGGRRQQSSGRARSMIAAT